MIDCKEKFYRDLDKLLNEERDEDIVIGYSVTITYAKAKTNKIGDTIVIGGGIPLVVKTQALKLIETVDEQVKEGE